MDLQLLIDKIVALRNEKGSYNFWCNIMQQF